MWVSKLTTATICTLQLIVMPLCLGTWRFITVAKILSWGSKYKFTSSQCVSMKYTLILSTCLHLYWEYWKSLVDGGGGSTGRFHLSVCCGISLPGPSQPTSLYGLLLGMTITTSICANRMARWLEGKYRKACWRGKLVGIVEGVDPWDFLLWPQHRSHKWGIFRFPTIVFMHVLLSPWTACFFSLENGCPGCLVVSLIPP
jgi:hypothetical protein